MHTYIIRRILQAIPILFILSILLFGIVRMTPGGPLAAAERNPNISKEQIQKMRQKLGLDQPLPIQYLRWVEQIVTEGDLGDSVKFRRPVTEMIIERIPNTLILVGVSFLVTLLIAFPIGIIAAIKPQSTFDTVTTTFAFMGQSVPVYWLGLVLIVIFYMTIHHPVSGNSLFPVGGMHSSGREDLPDLLWHMVLPVTALSLTWAGWYSRYLRASMREVIHEDYVRTARAKGVKERMVIYKHALRNALLPVVTLIALDLPALFGGVLFVETIFSWPGMGRLFWDAARGRDYPILMGIIMIEAGLILACNLLADLLYGLLDPRVRYE